LHDNHLNQVTLRCTLPRIRVKRKTAVAQHPKS
jgi:hypothetical protein